MKFFNIRRDSYKLLYSTSVSSLKGIQKYNVITIFLLFYRVSIGKLWIAILMMVKE
jgi:hypothetical protein